MKLINSIKTLALAVAASFAATGAWAELSIPTGNAAEAGGTLNYVITSADELAQMADIFDNVWNYKTVNIKIANDIDFAGKKYKSPEVGSPGTPDNKGSGFSVYIYADDNKPVTISNLSYITEETSNVGFIGHVHNSTPYLSIRNITLKNVTFAAACDAVGNGAGAFVGFTQGNAIEIVNCHVQNSALSGARYVAGMVGYCHANGNDKTLSFSNCSVTDTTLNAGYKGVGGFVGYCVAEVSISECDSSGNTYVPQTNEAGLFIYRLNTADTYANLSQVTSSQRDVWTPVYEKLSGAEYDITWKEGAPAATPVAQVGSTEYTTLAEAILAAQDGATIEILDGTWDADAVGSMTTDEALSVRTKSLTIQPADEASPKFTANVTLGYDDSSTRNATITVKGLAFENAQLLIGNYAQTTVEGCSFVGSGNEAALRIIESCASNYNRTDFMVDQVTVKDCTFNGTKTGVPAIRVRDSGNVLITGNTIANSNHNGILLESDTKNSRVNTQVSKTVVIQNNLIKEWHAGNVADGGRGIRAALGTMAAGSSVTISGNVFRKEQTGFDSPDYVNISDVGSGNAVDLSGNDWNNMLLSEVAGNNAIYTCDAATTTIISVITTKEEVKVDTTQVDTTVVDASGNTFTPTTEQQAAAVNNTKTAAAQAIAANTPAAEKTGTGIKTVDESAYLKIALEKAVVEVSENDASLKTLVFDVQPMKVVGSVETKIQNSEITKPITFRLPLTDDFTISALITHAGDDDRVVPVQGTSGQKYVELTFTHFSEVTATPTDKVESSIASTEQLGIIRYAPTDLYTESKEVAVGVPWLSTSSTDASDVAVTVAELIATGLTSGDQISVWDKANKRYDVWQWNGSSWEAALDADSGSTKSAYTTKVERGQAFWYKRNDTTKTFALIGRPKDNATTTPEAGASKNPKYNLMSNPYPDAIDLAELVGTEGDQIVTIPDGTFYTYTTAEGGWCTREWVEDTSVTLPWLPGNHHPVSEQLVKQGSLVIPSGRSFWYISKGGTPAIDWKSLKVTE